MGWGRANIPSQKGKVFIVTGSNSGVGFATVEMLAEKEATVIMACRSSDKGLSAARMIRERVPQADVSVERLDLASLASIAEFTKRMQARLPHLDVLINNAGVLVPFARTEDGFEMQIGTNFLGHFALSGQMLALLNAAPNARIVTLSSFAHWIGRINFDNLNAERGYNRTIAYCQSKLATLVFAHELQRRLGRSGTSTCSMCAHPGVAQSNISQHSILVDWGMKLAAQPATEGALPSLRAAIDPSIKGGDYVGPDSLLRITGAPIVQSCSAASRDPVLGSKLWECAQQMTGIHYL